MTDISEILQQLRKAESKVQHLEEVNRRILDALDFVASLGDLQLVSSPEQDATAILDTAQSNIGRIAPFRAKAFFTLGEDELEMTLTDSKPEEQRKFFQDEVDRLIDNGTFAWALNQNRPLVVAVEGTGDAVGRAGHELAP